MMQDPDTDNKHDELSPRPWIVLSTTYDVEAWIDSYNRDLQRAIENNNLTGYGICFSLAEGGDIYLHTTPDGDVLLDVTPEAEWVSPLISAVTHVVAPPSQIWALPGHTLTQLVLGLSPLITATRIVLQHDYKMKKMW